VNPKRVQSTPTPEGDRDNITVNNSTGYGIAQWTSSGRQQGLVDLARSRGLQIEGDLALQLDFLLKEVDESYAGIRLTPDLRSSSDYFMTQFERPKDQSEAAKVKRASAGQQVLELYGGGAVPDPSQLTATEGCNSTGATGQAAGFVGFPLQTTKERMTKLNGGQFSNGAMSTADHGYVAFDIMADPDTPVVSILPGKVVSVSEDKCPGRLVSIFDETKGVTVSYLHMSISKTLVKKGDVVTAGQIIGFVGQGAEACGSAHLHIDVAAGDSRPGCKRESCPAANQAIFEQGEAILGLAKGLFDTYEKLP
jgi:murein DD-endopeptidase MepM/ murein hydrolase activator NlpD